MNRKKGTRAFTPDDFIADEPKTLTPKQLKAELDVWAKAINRRYEA